MRLDWTKWKIIYEKYRIVIMFGCTLMVLFIIFCCYQTFHLNNEDDYSQPNLNTDKDSSLINEQSTNNKTKQNNKENITSEKSENKGSCIFVDIKGAVQHPDIYKMKDTDRVKQLVDKAILLKDADLSKVNLAEKLQDQKVIYIPKIGDADQENLKAHDFSTKNNHVDKSENDNHITNSEKINVNHATEAQLLTINGIGPSKAKAIIEYREQHGAFESVEQLKDVNGIGAKTLEKISEKLTV